MKRCCKSKEEKTLDSFSKCTSNRDGLNNACRDCAKIYWANRPIKVKREVQEGFKTCSCCNLDLPLAAFGNNPKGKGGLYSRCKPCVALKSKVIRSQEGVQETLNKINREYYSKNSDKIYSRTSEYAKRNRHIYNKASSEWSKRNVDKCRAACTKRRAIRLRAVPAWANSEWDKFLVDEMYHLAMIRGEVDNITYHVDHIVPLNSSLVCGLHWSGNLQILTEKENLVKGNRYWSDMPIQEESISV